MSDADRTGDTQRPGDPGGMAGVELPPRGSTLGTGLRFAARMADRRLDEFAGRLRSVVTIATLSIGGAFLFVYLPRAIWVPGSTPGGVAAVAVVAAIAIAAGLALDAQGGGGWGAWLGRTLLIGVAMALVTVLFALGIRQPAGWVVSALLPIVFFIERLYMKVTAMVVERTRRAAGSVTSKLLTVTLGDRLTDGDHEEIRRLIERGGA